MAHVINIPPNFGIKEFDMVTEAGEFLQKFGFEVIRRLKMKLVENGQKRVVAL